jgi:hypothetical protein
MAPTSAEQVLKHFYRRFQSERTSLLSHIKGVATETDRAAYASLLLKRLMVIYFLQQHGLLDGDTRYLCNRLQTIQACRGEDTFYHHFLLDFFDEVLAKQEHAPHVLSRFGTIPKFALPLFALHALEQDADSIFIADEVFARLFTFFDDYQWQLGACSDGCTNVLYPDVLGFVFEQQINHQQMGAYYTGDDVTAYITSNTIVPALLEKVQVQFPTALQSALWQWLKCDPDRYIQQALSTKEHLPAETERDYTARRVRYQRLRARLCSGEIEHIHDLVTYNLNIRQFAQDVLTRCENPALLYTFFTCLRELTVLDPTCGSGAFLFAALRVLEPLYDACIERTIVLTGNWEQRAFSAILALVRLYPNRRYCILKSILTHNLYGLDFMEEAVEMCQLRVYLELLSCIERVEDIEPALDLKLNIRVGNALVGVVNSYTVAGEPEGALCERLDCELASTYGIAAHDRARFEQWRSSHKPFHWSVTFHEVMQNGGFAVIVGNPPYVEYKEEKFFYTLLACETRSCGNLYPIVVERSHTLLSPRGWQGMILPLAAFATRNMLPFIDGFLRWFPCSWLSFYHFRPSMLFCSGKVASLPAVIYLAKASGQQQRFSTAVTKWAAAQRQQLFSSLSYCQVTTGRDPENRHYYAKFGTALENALLEKLLCHTTVKSYLAGTAGANSMFYRSAGGLYWKVFLNFAWPYQTTSNKQCTFRDEYDRDVFVALFNSSLFWWYYTVTFDTFNLKDYMLFGFRFSYPQSGDLIAAFKALCQRLMHDYQSNARHLKRGVSDSYTIYAKKSKSIIDEIDCLLGQHYGFSNEEIDFIINYDVKYRIGEM